MELVDVLDDLFRSSRAAQLTALEHIHSILADVCVRTHDPHQRPRFLQQQNDFETNIVSRILSSGVLSASSISRTIDEIRAKTNTSSAVIDIISLALSALQGMALIHARSKTYLGRRLGIQTLLDLLTALRHASVNPDDPDTTITSGIDAGLKACRAVIPACMPLETGLSFVSQPTPKPTRVSSKPSATKPLAQSPPAPTRVLQTPRRPKTKQTPVTESRPRTQVPLERTVSGDSTLSVLSSRSDATDASAGPEMRMNERDAEMRSVSRSSTYSMASTASNMTESSAKSSYAQSSYSSSTVSSTSTNRTLENPHLPDKYLRIHPPTPSQTRPTSPNAITQECFVPLPESPVKTGGHDVQETPKPKRKFRDEARDGNAQDTPRAKTRYDQAGESASNPRIFPVLGSNLLETSSSNPFKPSTSISDALKAKPTAPALATLSLLKGDIDYEPESPKKYTPSRNFANEADEPLKAHYKMHNDAHSTPAKDSASNPFRAPSSKPSKDSIADTNEPNSATKPTKRRPRASEILPRPTPSRPVPRNVSTPATPAVSTPARTKKVAIIPGGVRVPGRDEGGSELRKSMALGVKELKRSQLSNEALQRSQGSNDGLRRSHLSTEGLKRNQPSSEALGRNLEVSQSTSLGDSDSRQDGASRSKRSAPSTPIPSRSDGGRKAGRDGVGRVKRDGIDSEGRSSGEIERNLGSDSGKRSSLEDSPSRTRGIPIDGKMVRTSAEKKELLGAWLGNVDALVEGVQRAGVWGLR
ncbi:Cell division control protein 14, SIN component [Rhizoctonia solani]|uniref:Cell division control protein 14, SIN component n=1 Tax=Rhizoctonia solani TaxID=456999 RepID=A0A8H8SSM4_9AGAM|nr:Cell division control protein 14, SIN component [Rhizoctonia solani]QRW16169.1 Cell division control protein 14, SIN component [Rhizoctonia solani]